MSKILYIEDVPESAQLAERVLENEEHDIILAATGLEGLEKLKSQSPDVILLDLGLPDIDHGTMAQRICEQNQNAHTPIIVISAWPESEVRRITEAYCFNEYLLKPYDVDELVDIVQSHLE